MGASAPILPPLPSARPRSLPEAFLCSALRTTATTLFLQRRVFPTGSSLTRTGRHSMPSLPRVAVTHSSPRWTARHRPYSLSTQSHLLVRPIPLRKPATTRCSSYLRLDLWIFQVQPFRRTSRRRPGAGVPSPEQLAGQSELKGARKRAEIIWDRSVRGGQSICWRS